MITRQPGGAIRGLYTKRKQHSDAEIIPVIDAVAGQAQGFNHLTELLELGYAVDIDRLVLGDRKQKILQAIAAIGAVSRRNLRDYLGESYGYDEIHLVQAWWRQGHPDEDVVEF